jgi:hypothetical protein
MSNDTMIDRFTGVFCKGLRYNERKVTVHKGYFRPSDDMWFVELTNLPAATMESYCGAEQENNRLCICMERKGDKVKVSTLVNMVTSREDMLRGRTSTPEKAAEYVSAYINRVLEKYPPRFTHTK